MPNSDLAERMKKDCKILGLGHRNRFTKYRDLHMRIGLPSALLATAAGAIQTVDTTGGAELIAQIPYVPHIGLALTWTVALLTATNSFVRPSETAQAHREKTGAFEALLSRIDRAVARKKDDDELQSELESVDKEIDALKMSEPILSDSRIEAIRKQVEGKK
jgi:hypothetical protein